MTLTVNRRSGISAQPTGLADRLTRTFRVVLLALTLLTVVLVALFSLVMIWLRPIQFNYAGASRAVQSAHADMIDQETGLRGYLLIRDSTFLDPYQRGVDALAKNNETVAELIASDGALAPALLDMRLAQQAWTDRWAAMVVEGKAPVEQTALVSFLDEGRALFDVYRASEQKLIDLVEERRETAQQRVSIAFSVGLGLVIITASILAAGVARQRRTLSSLVVAPVDDIVEVTDAIARGDLDARIDASGPAELRRSVPA